MEHRKRIAILDESRDFRLALERTLSDKGYLIRISTADADLVLDVIRKKETDLLITDILLFGTDGTEFVRDAITASDAQRPKILVCSLIKEPTIIEELFGYGVSDYIHKHSPVSNIASHVERLCPLTEEICRPENSDNLQKLEKTVTSLLLSLGIPIKLKGFYYIRYAVIRSLISKEPAVGITKTVYPDLIKKYGATQKSAERAIRTAIEHIYRSGKMELLKQMFSYTGDSRPSNATFIAMITDNLRLYDADYRSLREETY